MKSFKPKLRGSALVVWVAGVLLLLVAAALFVVDLHRYGTTVSLLLLGAIGLNLLSTAMGRRGGTPAE